jgi:hypothetical protein
MRIEEERQYTMSRSNHTIHLHRAVTKITARSKHMREERTNQTLQPRDCLRGTTSRLTRQWNAEAATGCGRVSSRKKRSKKKEKELKQTHMRQIQLQFYENIMRWLCQRLDLPDQVLSTHSIFNGTGVADNEALPHVCGPRLHTIASWPVCGPGALNTAITVGKKPAVAALPLASALCQWRTATRTHTIMMLYQPRQACRTPGRV